uniref:C-type lectin domain-containing protein n=1 Tax=Timema cristinae TaxID=61476 RepID=A0A7R9GR22_TIMCR|nr:unnamed protein product [Timema cristinae]
MTRKRHSSSHTDVHVKHVSQLSVNQFSRMGLEARRQYICPPSFVRNGNSCYFFSTHMETWQEAHFACRDKGSELARLEKKWEDRNMQNYLNKPEFGEISR